MRAALVTLLVLALAAAAPTALAREAFSHDSPQMLALLGQIVTQVSGTNVYQCVNSITTEPNGLYRMMGTPTHNAFVAEHSKAFEAYGLKTQVVHFTEGNPAPQGVALPLTGGDNIIGVLPGRDLTKWVVVGGHYDTQFLTQGGAAIDNTSGICAVRVLAEAMTKLKLQPEATIIFAWWDGEEWGLYGSRAFVKDHNATKELLGLSAATHVDILAAMSFDIIGINYPAFNLSPTYGDPTTTQELAVLNLWAPPDDPEHFTLCPRYACYKYEKYSEGQLANFTNYQALVREAAINFLQLPPGFVQVKDDQYGRSDHVPFTNVGIPGLRVQGSHDAEFPQYHTPLDTLAAAQAMAGGETQLKGGFDRAADVGAIVAAYVALKGNVGDYGIAAAQRPGQILEIRSPQMPGFEALPLLAALAVLVLLRRRSA